MALVLLIGLMSIFLTSTCGLNLTSPSSEYQAALGDNISLGCHFTLASVDADDLEIEWTVNRSDGQEEEEHLICYMSDGYTRIHHFLGFEGRVHFSSPDPQDGDASLTIKGVKITDEGTYQCTVKKLQEVQSRQIKLTVMEEVSVPVYDSDGGTESNVDLKLMNNTKTTTGTTTVITAVTVTGTYNQTPQATTVVVVTSVFNQVFEKVHDTAETPAVDLSFTMESQKNSSEDGGVSVKVAAPITFIIIISASTIFCWWKQKRQQKSDEENVSADEERLVPTQPEMTTVMMEFDVVVITVPVLKNNSMNQIIQ